MTQEKTLERVARDIEFGDYGKARDRLHGLIHTYPNNLQLRQQLGEIYWKLQQPAMAGRYWYLVEQKSAEMLTACEAFEHACGNNSWKLLNALKFRGDPKSVGSEAVTKQLLDLQAQVLEEYHYFVKFQRKDNQPPTSKPTSNLQSQLVGASCLLSMLLALALMLIGLSTVLGWIF